MDIRNGMYVSFSHEPPLLVVEGEVKNTPTVKWRYILDSCRAPDMNRDDFCKFLEQGNYTRVVGTP